MKCVKVLIISILLSSVISAQWISLNPYPTPNHIYHGYPAGNGNIMGITSQGEILRSTDGGVNWEVNPLTPAILRGLDFVNQDYGWAVGSLTDKSYRTTDGGDTWLPMNNAPDTTKYAVRFMTQELGWSCGYAGFIIKSTNGGESWRSVSNHSVTSETLYGIGFTDAYRIFIVGNDETVIRSTDGGDTWELKNIGITSGTDLRSVDFPITSSGLVGYAAGDYSRIFKTMDGGETWQNIYNPGGSDMLWSITASPYYTVLACGESSTLLRSSDWGDTWSQVAIPVEDVTLYSVEYDFNGDAWLFGREGTILKSTDEGLTWTEISRRFTETTFTDISMADSLNGYVTGNVGFTAHTTDGGLTFEINDGIISQKIYEVSAPSPNVAFASAQDGIVVKTTNGGTDWTVLSTGLASTIDLVGIDFINENTGYAVGTDGVVIKTTDGGDTWIQKNISTTSLLWDVDFYDENFGWIVGTGEKIFATSDGGDSWEEQYSGGGLGTYGVAFGDKAHGVAGGTSGNTYYTSDGGSNWSVSLQPPTKTVWGVDFIKSGGRGLAVAACASGYIFISADMGVTWQEQPRKTINTFSDVDISGTGNAWIAGNYGTLIYYNNPHPVPVELLQASANVMEDKIELRWSTASEENNRGFRIERAGEELRFEEIGFIPGAGTSSEINEYKFDDILPGTGINIYHLYQIDFDGAEYLIGEIEGEYYPEKFYLAQNYPNPFNPETTVKFSVPRQAEVHIAVFDILGRLITVLADETYLPGLHELNFNGENLSSGTYFLKMNGETSDGEIFSLSRKMLLLK